MRDVFKPGDAWTRTDDLMRRDADGFYAFVDPIGEMIRRKGANVVTLEVGAALSAHPCVIEAIAYGIAVPGADGRAGMALLYPSDAFELAGPAAALEVSLFTRVPYSCDLRVKSVAPKRSSRSGARISRRVSILPGSRIGSMF